MLQPDEPTDYVVATGESYSVREFVEFAFAHAGLDWQKYVELDPRTCGPPRSTPCSATRRRRRRCWAGADDVDAGAGAAHGRRRHRQLADQLAGRAVRVDR